MDDQGCPRCKTTKYRNPSLKLMVNVCGHTLCESCVDLLFVRGAGNCPECGTPLRKSNFRVQLFEDPTVDKEVEIRKKVLKIYNKREEDFPSLREYNDFLEEVEEIVFNLTNNVDLENTKKKMEIYQKENKDVIQKNKLKLTREQEELEEALEVERQESEQRRLFIQKEEELQQILKRKNKQAFLDELESSDLPVALLLAQHKDRSTQLGMQLEKPRAMKPVTFSTGIKMGSLVLIVYLKDSFQDYAFKFFSTFYSKVNGLDIKEQVSSGLDVRKYGHKAKSSTFQIMQTVFQNVRIGVVGVCYWRRDLGSCTCRPVLFP